MLSSWGPQGWSLSDSAGDGQPPGAGPWQYKSPAGTIQGVYGPIQGVKNFDHNLKFP